MGYYYVYILLCADNTFYTGVTNNLKKRVDAHNTKATGAKYTKARRPVTLVYQKRLKDRSRAQQEEYLIRHLSHAEKAKLVAS
jgi:putative endonuclease